MPFCTNCGHESNGKFCENCGSPMPKPAQEPVQHPVSDAAPFGAVPNSNPYQAPDARQDPNPFQTPDARQDPNPFQTPDAGQNPSPYQAPGAYSAPEPPRSPEPNQPKSHTGLIIGICIGVAVLILAIVLVAVFAGGSSDPEPVPVETDSPVFTEPTETAAVPETEPTEPKTEPTEPETEPTEPEPTEGAPIVYTASHIVPIRDRVYLAEHDGLYYFEDGKKTCFYSGDFAEYGNICTDGNNLYAVVNNNSIICVNLTTFEAEPVTTIMSADRVMIAGASENILYLGTESGEEDWFGYTVGAYDMGGNLLTPLGRNWEPAMKDGVLLLYGYRGDVSPARFTAIDVSDSTTLMGTDSNTSCWAYECMDGVVYYATVPNNYYEGSHDLTLHFADRSGDYVLAGIPLNGGAYSASIRNGVLTVVFWDGSSQPLRYNAYTGEELDLDLYDEDTSQQFVGVDNNWLYYLVEDSDVYREDEEGILSYVCSGEDENCYVELIWGDYVYYRQYEPGSYLSHVYATYAPAQ